MKYLSVNRAFVVSIDFSAFHIQGDNFSVQTKLVCYLSSMGYSRY